MEGIKCPVCMAISITQTVEDGDMVTCGYCKAKYTVTRLRRFSVLAREMGKRTPQNMDYRSLEEYVRQLDNEPLLEMLRLITEELVARQKKRDRS